MKKIMGIVVACLSIGFALDICAEKVIDDGDYEEIVIRRRVKKKKRKPEAKPKGVVTNSIEVVTNTAGVTTSAKVAATNIVPVTVKAPEPPPPPEPPVEDAAEPRRLVRYFCKCWKDEDYERLWWAMTPEYRKNTPFKKFSKLFKDNKEINGGVIDENIVVDDVQLDDGGIQVTVDLSYKFKRVGVRRVKAVVEKKGTVYRIRESGIIPLDMDDL